ncbi:MAG: PorT family protein [Flavobacteriaceae bacterium]|nr:PorT family protein [Bacteroidia bacterium]MBT8288166.1 PorT family protein [Bacteroidia bacterium]NNF74616.1 PorT family protein [Flavobacteriaceae bacterium]NNK72974.1 PorT family protein [Flavobacteriaceae bacterium]
MKNVFLILVALLFSFTINAQGVDLGLKAGLNLSSFSGDDTEDLSMLTGIHFGAMADISISDGFSVQPEVLYSTQGTKYSESDGYDGKLKFNYLNIPVIAKVEVTDGLNLEAGPQIGFLLSAKDEFNSPGDSGEEDVKEFFKATDFAFALGLSYEMETGLYLGARYNFGIIDVWDTETGFTNRNSVFQFSVGYLFDLAPGTNSED